MKLYYVTLNSWDEARKIGHSLLKNKLAVCINWFPITCAYRWEDKITEEPEVVLIVKSQDGYKDAIAQNIKEHINYTNFIAEISPTNVERGFIDWLDREIPVRFLEPTNS
jgi:periplasmic divalent cation tolerance protein